METKGNIIWGFLSSTRLFNPDTSFPHWISVRVTCFGHLWKDSSEASASHLGLLNLTQNCVEFSSITMSNRFLGTWKLVSSEHFDDYMKALGKKHSLLWVRRSLKKAACLFPSNSFSRNLGRFAQAEVQSSSGILIFYCVIQVIFFCIFVCGNFNRF